MKSRKFTPDDQMMFAKLSGDFNPLHIDAIVARRLLFGGPVVHGIHSVLWGWNCWLENTIGNIEICSLKASFPKPIKVDEEVGVSWDEKGDGCVVINVLSAGLVCATVEIEYSKIEKQPDFTNLKYISPDRVQPRDLSEDEVEGAEGSLDLCVDIEMASNAFPHLLRCVSPLDVAAILGTTRLIGVECPGLQSVFFELNLRSRDLLDNGLLEYAVNKFDRRYSLVFMEIKAPRMIGSIKSFFRPKARDQGHYLDLKKLVDDDEFFGQRALVLGGSRGLGEVAAKLLAAGSADVKVTYKQGKTDAHRVVGEIRSYDGRIGAFYLDALDQEQDTLRELLSGWVPTHVYYFVTPFIFAGVKGRISIKLFAEFNNYYFAGFLSVLTPLINAGVKRIFYPSSVAIDEVPLDMGEYAAAKAAGEILCQFLQKSFNGLKIYKPRLPRMSTDQTASFMPHLSDEESAPIMLDHLRLFRDMSIKQ